MNRNFLLLSKSPFKRSFLANNFVFLSCETNVYLVEKIKKAPQKVKKEIKKERSFKINPSKLNLAFGGTAFRDEAWIGT